MFWYLNVLVWFGLSTCWSVDVSVCRRFGLLRFWYVDVLVCRHFGIPVFRFVDVLVVDVSVSRRFHQLPTKGSTLTHQILFINMVIILQSTYRNDIFHNFALLEFYFLNMIYLLLDIDFILSIFFQHSNILTRASHHWCLASNIVLVTPLRHRAPWLSRVNCRRYFKIHFIVCKDFILIKIWSEFVSKGPINNLSGLI